MKLKNLWWVLLVVYVALAYWLKVFSRVFTGSAGVEWQPFWTYKAILNEGKEYLVADIVNNVLLFMSIGACGYANSTDRTEMVERMDGGFVCRDIALR